jgi:hypothetical protein
LGAFETGRRPQLALRGPAARLEYGEVALSTTAPSSVPTLSPELVLVVPVFNEEDAIVPVLAEWRAELARTVGAGRFDDPRDRRRLDRRHPGAPGRARLAGARRPPP